MRIYLTGADGILGTALTAALRSTPATADWPLLGVSILDFDIADEAAVTDSIERFQPDVVVHAAANAVVDDCEANPQLAMRVNIGGTHHVAAACRRAGARLIYISSDYVFDGRARPDGGYPESHVPNPLSVYGLTKLAGERIVSAVPGHLVVRTSWLFGGRDEGTDNVLALVRRSPRGEVIPLVSDQFSRPTYAADLAQALVRLLARPAPVTGTVHVANAGTATWYEVGGVVMERLAALGLGNGRLAQPQPVPMADCGFLGGRPADSSLNTDRLAGLGIALPHWTDAVGRFCALLAREAAGVAARGGLAPAGHHPGPASDG
jgi:dTDP-4-dehydrorhamnose reductase